MIVKIWIKDNETSGFVGYVEHITYVKKFSTAKAIATKKAQTFARVYGHYPKQYGAEEINEQRFNLGA